MSKNGATMNSTASALSGNNGESEELATMIRTQTSKQHSVSNKLINMLAPFALSSPRVYRLLLKSFYHVFKAMEEEMEQRRLQFPKITPVYFRELRRTAAFEMDLSYYDDADQLQPSTNTDPSPATIAYIAEMKRVIDTDPILVIAYTQTLYMGILAGGAIIRRWLINAFNLNPPEGVAIFDFSSTIPDTAAFKETYKDAINSISLTAEQKARIINQKKRVFECNNELIKEVCWSHAYRRRICSLFLKLVAVLIAALLLWTFVLSKK